MKNKGFTLIELLAVIVVLAIVMVLAATTVLPYMAKARKEAFLLEAKALKNAASQAVSLISIGVADETQYTKYSDTSYCFTMENLKNLGLLKKDSDNYFGIVYVRKVNNSYEHILSMYNEEYFVDSLDEDASYIIDAVEANIGYTPFVCSE